MPAIDIGGRPVGPGHPAFVMAEVGLNHNGDLDRAFEMIHVASRAGCDAVKFQTFRAAEFVNDPAQMFTYRSQGREVTESMLAMFQRYELPDSAWPAIKAECAKAGVLFLSTPQNRSDLDVLLKVGVPAVKIGSDDFTNLPLIRSYAETGLPLILSCGMSDLAEVYQALSVAGALDGYPAALLLCTSQYPTAPEDVNLRKLTTLQAAFPGLITGFSDHTQGSLASSLAVAMGAVIFEKHFTLDHDLPGPDHWFSETPDTLAQWVAGIRKASTMLGSALVRPTRSEGDMRKIARRSLVALMVIGKGESLTLQNVGARRPGNGFPPGLLDQLLGTVASREIPAGTVLGFGDVSKS
ncbi:MAG: N-acetylneuraminate synthase family protein [Gammaproteobacteria bacterium]